MPIRLLNPEIVGKIAAGEVVERPSSVVKELVENAIDAGARRISVEIAAGGCDLIRVADDGRGIERDELQLAIARHATSKIASADDLGRITTLGFRGEALASIAAVSEVSVASRAAGSTIGYEVIASGATGAGVAPVARAPGTTVTVEKLFFNVPARRKFLRSAPAEAGQIAGLVSQFALAYPEVSFELASEGRRALSTPGTGDALDAAVSVLGHEAAAALLAVEAAVEAERPYQHLAARVTGFVAEPRVTRATRSSIWLFVNRRLVKSRALTHAVLDGYATLLQVGRYPIAIVNLEVPATDLDVNVHPAKSEVRLLHERLIYGALRDAVRSTVSASSAWAKQVSVESAPAPQPGAEWDGWGTDRLVEAPIQAPSGQDVMAGGRRLPILRVIGQVAQTYIIAEGDGGIYLIDQHAAHERVLLEQLTKSMGSGSNTQLMLEPASVDVGAAESEILQASMPALEELGYRLEPFGEGTVLVRGVPVELAGGRALDALRETLSELAEERPTGEWKERVAISLSCRGAVKAGQVLAPEEMRALVMALEEMDITQHCSHGRPTAILLSRTQLEKEFGRR